MAKTNKGLGRGLGALLADSAPASQEAPSHLPIQKLEPNPDQPRRDFDEESLIELADSIRQHGLIQPIAVRPLSTGFYQIIAGERRWRAARQAGLTQVPVIIHAVDDAAAAQLALIENLQREDLNPLEEARGYETLIETHGLTQEQVADAVSRSRPAVTNALRLLRLPEPILSMVRDGSLSAGHARALIPLEDRDLQYDAAREIVEKQLSVRQTEALVKRLQKPAAPEPERSILEVDYLKECQTELTRKLARKVQIKSGRSKGKGTVVLSYYSEEDLQRLIELLGMGD